MNIGNRFCKVCKFYNAMQNSCDKNHTSFCNKADFVPSVNVAFNNIMALIYDFYSLSRDTIMAEDIEDFYNQDFYDYFIDSEEEAQNGK